ncbi:hypothetical protein BE17_44760 [Sorangium cellulosum]|uniref:Uncharacterized protein n=1 Tax=Sorangium cellulosum TaxID=56 RepID=A0A150R9W4_SORCE|nr:hypothetical protein BE17_44760 [Sorangium cellulosum]
MKRSPRKGNPEKLPALKGGPREAGDGAVLDSFDAWIRGRASVGVWRELGRALDGRVDAGAESRGEELDYTASFFALPAATGPIQMLVTGLLGQVEPAAPEAAVLHLRWELLSDGPPPPYIVRSSNRVGGWPAVLELIAARWPGPRKVTAEVSATYVIKTAVYKLDEGMELSPERSSQRQRRVTQTAAEWRIEPPSGPVGRVSLARISAEELVVATSGHHELTLGSNLGAELNDAVWEGLRPLLVSP